MIKGRGDEFLHQGGGNGVGWKYRIQKKQMRDHLYLPSTALHIYYYYCIVTTTIT